MVRCPDCETPNSVDSKFCKFCGAALPEEELVGAQVKLTELLNEGYRIFNEGRTDEALLVAESALESSATSTQALSLKAMCCERTGELAEALELYEKVVELNPESALDKIKVTHLRNQLNAKVVEVPPFTRKKALIAAVATGVLVISVGAILAATMGGQKSPTAMKTDTSDDQKELAFTQPNTPAVAQQTTPKKESSSGIDESGSGVVIPPQTFSKSGQMPVVIGTQTGYEPVTPTGIIPNTSDPNNRKPDPDSTENRVKPNDRTDPPPKPEDTKKEDTGIIEITVHHTNDRGNGGGSDSTSRPNELKVLLRTASDQFILGDFARAAKTYEKALQAGGNQATLNQRIGQCYANLHRTSEAINAYTKAVAAYKDALTRSNSPVLRSGLDACQNALKLLRNE
jgi:tetratricopeptide (TPR) repeat protein